MESLILLLKEDILGSISMEVWKKIDLSSIILLLNYLEVVSGGSYE